MLGSGLLRVVFTETLWPDFGTDDFRCPAAFAARDWRFGADELPVPILVSLILR
jgi:hypothetical protein